MAAKYSKAPISELIFGVIFNSNILSRDGIMFELIRELNSEYPILHTQPAIFEEDWIDNKISINMDYDKSGFSLYRLYTPNYDYMVQLQQNCILLNWVKKDEIAVGKYPGFTEVFERFNKIIQGIFGKFSNSKELKDLDVLKQIKCLSLTYHDRVPLEPSGKEEDPLKRILNASFPKMNYNGVEHHPGTIMSKFILPCPQLNGYDTLAINTTTDSQNKRILVIENRIKGGLISNNINDWFKTAHDTQVSFFEDLFTKEILKTWQ